MSTTRPNAAPLKVIGLGLPRTGTSSLRDALAILGLGPCYHMTSVIKGGGADLAAWGKIGDGNGTTEDFDNLLREYNSVVDAPAALFPEGLYSAYPDAKFILTTRDPAKWEKSMNSTILHVTEIMRMKPVKTPYEDAMLHWSKTYLQDKFFGGRLEHNAEQEFLNHTERIKKLIPSEKLLVYEVSEGWDRLVDFLGVPKPEDPFPHVNDTAQFLEMAMPKDAGDSARQL